MFISNWKYLVIMTAILIIAPAEHRKHEHLVQLQTQLQDVLAPVPAT